MGKPVLADGRLRIDIVGAGPLDAALRAQATRLGIADAVVFHGWTPHDRFQEILAQAHVLAFPSVREFGGGVVLEAMALGVPPIVVDYAGPGELVSERFGFKAAIGSRAVIVTGVQQALEAALARRRELPEMGAAAQAEVAARHVWARKADTITAWWRDIARATPSA